LTGVWGSVVSRVDIVIIELCSGAERAECRLGGSEEQRTEQDGGEVKIALPPFQNQTTSHLRSLRRRLEETRTSVPLFNPTPLYLHHDITPHYHSHHITSDSLSLTQSRETPSAILDSLVHFQWRAPSPRRSRIRKMGIKDKFYDSFPESSCLCQINV
jgi:hypothetical protein